jgi:serine protease inhibitor
MAMVYTVARGSTSAQIKKVFSYPMNYKVLLKGYKALTNNQKSTGNFTLSAANRILIHDDYRLLKAYSRLVNNNFGALVESTKKILRQKVCSIINSSVEKQTHGKITDIIFDKAFRTSVNWYW